MRLPVARETSPQLTKHCSYKQALHGAQKARSLASKHKFPFTRPADYFAEMVKSDSHMERIRHRLLNETAEIKRGEDKRKERQNKKYGKQIQVEKQKERERAKKDMDERIKGLKRSEPQFQNAYRAPNLTVTQSGRVPWTMLRPTEKTSTSQLKTPSQIDPRNVPRVLMIPTVPSCLAKPETVNLASVVSEDGQNKTRNRPRMTLSLGEGVVRVRSLKRVVGAVKRFLQSDPGRAREWMQRLAGKITSHVVLASWCQPETRCTQ